jgi:glycosyltransferase involved in cell wall biosynthesis
LLRWIVRCEGFEVAHILLIAYSTYISDGRVKRHAEALAKRGDQVDVICLASDQQTEPNGVNIIGLPMPRYRGSSRSGYMGSYSRFFAKASLKALSLALKHRYDAVIVCTMPDAAILCALPLKLLGSRVLLDVHDTMPELYRDKFGGRRGALGARLLMLEERASAWLADRVLAVHELHARRLEQAGVSRDKLSVVVNAPDPAIFQSFDGNHSNGSEHPFTLICHGTISRRLGVDIAIQAVDLLKDRLPRLRLRVVGIGDYKQEAQALAARLKLDGRVVFEHRVPIERLPSVLSQASIGLVPNRASSACDLMLPAKLMEYAVLGIPTIAARLRTIYHYFGDAVRFFEPGDPAALAEAIEHLYHDPEARRTLAKRAKRVADELAWPIQRQRFYRAVDLALANSNA